MDPRIKVAVKAIEVLETLTKSKIFRNDFSAVKSKVMELKFIDDLSFLESESAFFETYDYNRWKIDPKAKTEVRWVISVLKNLRKKLKKGRATSILFGLDTAVGEIITASKLTDNLTVCRVGSKIGDFTIVTNLKVKKKNHLPFVVLPPIELGGVKSEAMFVWGPIKDLKEVDWKQVEGHVSELI